MVNFGIFDNYEYNETKIAGAITGGTSAGTAK